LPWGDPAERQRAVRVAERLPDAIVPERLGLGELAAVMTASAGVVGVDTGLTHLAAALAVPVVGIYGATDPAATGVYAAGPALNLGTIGRLPSVDEVVNALQQIGVVAPSACARQQA